MGEDQATAPLKPPLSCPLTGYLWTLNPILYQHTCTPLVCQPWPYFRSCPFPPPGQSAQIRRPSHSLLILSVTFGSASSPRQPRLSTHTRCSRVTTALRPSASMTHSPHGTLCPPYITPLSSGPVLACVALSHLPVRPRLRLPTLTHKGIPQIHARILIATLTLCSPPLLTSHPPPRSPPTSPSTTGELFPSSLARVPAFAQTQFMVCILPCISALTIVSRFTFHILPHSLLDSGAIFGATALATPPVHARLHLYLFAPPCLPVPICPCLPVRLRLPAHIHLHLRLACACPWLFACLRLPAPARARPPTCLCLRTNARLCPPAGTWPTAISLHQPTKALRSTAPPRTATRPVITTTSPPYRPHHHSPPPLPNQKQGSFQKEKEKKRMRPTSSSTLCSVLRTTAPRRLASTSSATAVEGAPTSSTAQKKAQDSLGTASAAATRGGTYARSALGPLGSRLSGLLAYLLSSRFPFPSNNNCQHFFFRMIQRTSNR